jgi:rod shape-determining protein MreC
MNSTGSSSNVFVDVGTSQGVQRGMAVITPAGIVGKITAVYPTASMVLLANDPLFAAGVVSQKHRVQGTLKGEGSNPPAVDFVQNEQAVDPGEWFFTSGNDFIFPRGLRVGTVTAVKNGTRRKDIQLRLTGLDQALEHVLVIIQGVHSAIPDAPVEAPVSLLPPPSDTAPAPDGRPSQAAQTGPLATDADVIVDKLRRSGTVRSAAPDPTPQPTSPAVRP